MIKRYTRKEISAIWEDYNRYSIWLSIELAAAEAMEKFKIIPKGVVKKVKSKARINPKRILKIESKVKHDIIAFLTSITEKAGKEARYLHKGMTSSDVLDTCFNLQLKQSGEILLKDINLLLQSIKKQDPKPILNSLITFSVVSILPFSICDIFTKDTDICSANCLANCSI